MLPKGKGIGAMRAILAVAVVALVGSAAVTAGAAPTRHPSRTDSGYVQVAGLFGESDEEKAARLQHEADQDGAISDLKQRVHDLETSLQQITGQNEELTHRIAEAKAALEKQRKDTEYKFCSLTAQLMGVAASGGGGISCDTGSVSTAAAAVPDTPAAAAQKEFDAAMNLLARAQYDEARAAFHSFVETYPKDELAPQALYWSGNIAFVQKDYAGAAQAFAEGIKTYPKSPRAPENMLKLGQTLIALGQQKEGCLTLGAIKSKYPKAPTNVLSQAASARSASCK
jgi:tol-pal system protein YbgF